PFLDLFERVFTVGMNRSSRQKTAAEFFSALKGVLVWDVQFLRAGVDLAGVGINAIVSEDDGGVKDVVFGGGRNVALQALEISRVESFLFVRVVDAQLPAHQLIKERVKLALGDEATGATVAQTGEVGVDVDDGHFAHFKSTKS